MTIKQEISFSEFKPWSGAVDAFDRIISEGKADEAENYLEEIAPKDGWTDTAINDLLWFEADEIYKALGMKPTDTETHDAEEIMEAWKDAQPVDFEPVRVKFAYDVVSVIYTDLDDPEAGEMSEELTAEEVAELFGDDHGEIDAAARTVETWED